MKKTIAKICMWTLGKLGYEKSYTPQYEIKISIDAEDAIKTIKKLQYETERLKESFLDHQRYGL